jgi:CRISPR-associated endonuclease Cas2
MYKLVFYDIENDKTRTQLAKKLEELGLVRLQHSVFIGNGSLVYWSKVFEKIKTIAAKFNAENDSCCLLAAEEKQIKTMKIFGKKEIMDNFIIANPAYLIL